MYQVLVTILFVILLSTSTGFTQPYSKYDLQRVYKKALNEEGFSPSIDTDGDVKFKYEGKVYFVIIDESDPNFFKIILPRIWNIGGTEDLIYASIASEYATRRTKTAEAYISGNNNSYVSIAVEIFLKDPKDVQEIITRSLQAMQVCRNEFHTKVKTLIN